MLNPSPLHHQLPLKQYLPLSLTRPSGKGKRRASSPIKNVKASVEVTVKTPKVKEAFQVKPLRVTLELEKSIVRPMMAIRRMSEDSITKFRKSKKHSASPLRQTAMSKVPSKGHGVVREIILPANALGRSRALSMNAALCTGW
ncbi:hypothetical protein GYMLUDRAFT_250201 [Collybiopsis luxurians FD-317 M1]|uniref:Uncharacterized protein n=1 Tax=Collybiopsis luxurians FD-317 M1 TaxID=944289 RepID=A0A0D0CF92_9AGAR|nr:hypothetical protein GYMLUDRAFT_250201 [Collybiopsis luxurians FD-317 M1]